MSFPRTGDDEHDMPRSSLAQDINEVGEPILQSTVAAMGWKCDPHRKDFGFDGTVAVFENSRHTGIEFSYQLKSKAKFKRTKAGLVICPDFKKRTINLFKRSNGSAVIFIVETSTKTVYWEFATIAIDRRANGKAKKPTAQKVTLQISRNPVDEAGVKDLVETLRRINREIPRPVQPSPGASIQLAKLDAVSTAQDIRADLQDAVDIANGGHYQRALEKGLGLLDRTSNDNDRIRVLKLLSKGYFELGQDDAAIEYTRKGLNLTDPGLTNNLISLLARANRFDDVRDVVASLGASLSNHPMILAAIGFSRLVEDKPDEALPYLDAAIKAEPKLLEAKLNRAFILRDRGDYADAKAGLKDVFERQPTYDEARVAYANILLMENELSPDKSRLDEARGIYSNIIDRLRGTPPKDLGGKDAFATSLIGLAAVENRCGNLERGCELLLETLNKGHRWRTVFYNLAQCEMALGKANDARGNYIRALRAQDGDRHRPAKSTPGGFWQAFASCLVAVHDSKPADERRRRFMAKACWAYQVSMKRDPNSFAFLNFGVVLIRLDRLEEAEQLAAKCAHRRGGHYLRAMCFKKRQDWPKMLAALEAERSRDPKAFQVNAELGDYYFERKKNYPEAQRYYEIASSLPDWFLHTFASELGAKLSLCLVNSKGFETALEFLLPLPKFLQQTPFVTKAYNSILQKQTDPPIMLWLRAKKN
jgi:tetratricopeptide (TPR) repeat protein